MEILFDEFKITRAIGKCDGLCILIAVLDYNAENAHL